MREGFSVDEVLVEDGRVIGIAGRASAGAASPSARESSSVRTARLPRRLAVHAESTTRTRRSSRYYTYWSDLPMEGASRRTSARSRLRGVDTHDDLTMVVAGWPAAELERTRRHRGELHEDDRDGSRLRRAPPAPSAKPASSGSRCRTSSASRSGRAGPSSATPATTKTPSPRRGSRRVPRRRALRDRPRPVVPGSARSTPRWPPPACRDAALPMYEFTCSSRRSSRRRLSSSSSGAMHGNQEAMDGFARVGGAVMSPADFFDGR